MKNHEREELYRLSRKAADEKQKEFEDKLAPALDLWRSMQAKNPWMK